jgi:hypothetical protein
MIAAAMPPVSTVSAIEAGISRLRVSAALASAVGSLGVIDAGLPRAVGVPGEPASAGFI